MCKLGDSTKYWKNLISIVNFSTLIDLTKYNVSIEILDKSRWYGRLVVTQKKKLKLFDIEFKTWKSIKTFASIYSNNNASYDFNGILSGFVRYHWYRISSIQVVFSKRLRLFVRSYYQQAETLVYSRVVNNLYDVTGTLDEDNITIYHENRPVLETSIIRLLLLFQGRDGIIILFSPSW